jgi:hypothetical protein
MNKYHEPFEVNCAALLVLGGGWWYVTKSEVGLSGVFLWLVALWGLPLMNACYGVSYLSKGPRYLVVAYGLLALVFLVLAWAIGAYALGAFAKVGKVGG